MPLPFLRIASGAYDLPAIMHRAWTRARAELVICIRLHIPTTTTLKTLDGFIQAETPC